MSAYTKKNLRQDVENQSPKFGMPAELDSSPAGSLLNSLLAAGVRIRHDCGGKALCGTCAVRARWASARAAARTRRPTTAARCSSSGSRP